MKHVNLTLFVVMMSISGYAQNKYQGRVTDSNGSPLRGATVTPARNPERGTLTSPEGNFEINLLNPQVVVSHVGFLKRTLKLKKGFNLIRLQEDIRNLNEVVITGSRERQKRSEVPAAIDVIRTESIGEAKAFGIDQLVNRASGVFMSTSRVAGNEQHFMAVRSPISTKALFLYLEDGLQIRPSSVFNHNALLEMNDLSYRRIEVLRGPASSIYGSESVGGSFNFITKRPSEDLNTTLGFQINNLGLVRYDLEVSASPNNRFGFYIGSYYVQRKNGPIQHSNYEKFALTFKTVYHFSDRTECTTVLDLIDYRSDMTGSLYEKNYIKNNFKSNQTFTERDALAFRLRSTFDTKWNDHNKTSFNLAFRNNIMNQNPSYRIRQFRDKGQLTGSGSGEINSNRFNSYVALLQHKSDFEFHNSTLIAGAMADFSPQNYVAERTDIEVDPKTEQNVNFTTRNGDFILNYKADILNYAGFIQYEISPLKKLKITAAIRYDRFEYNYRNRMKKTLIVDSRDYYKNFTPKIGVNYNFDNTSGLYANYSQGFTPPQVSTLYRNRNKLANIKPGVYDNYELGGYFIIGQKFRMNTALYLLEGKNTLISLRDENDVIFNTNAGKIRSYGVEYGFWYLPVPEITITHNAGYSQHRYVIFFKKGVNYSGTDRETAPHLLGMSKVSYRPFKGLTITGEHELVGAYNTSFEGQIDNGDGTFSTATYQGHNIFNMSVAYRLKQFEIWIHALNIFNRRYAARVSYSSFRNENRYTIGNPMAFHGGIRYKF